MGWECDIHEKENVVTWHKHYVTWLLMCKT